MARGKSVKPIPMPDLNQQFSPALLAQAIISKRTGLRQRQVDVAKNLGLSKNTIAKIENADPSVGLAYVLTVMEYLGLTFTLQTDEPISSQSATDNLELDDDWS